MKNRHTMLLLATLVMLLALVVPASAQTEPPYRLFLPAVYKSEQVLVLNAGADAFVFENGPDVNTGSELVLFAGNDQSEDGALGIMRSFVRFDLPNLNPGNVKRATLRLYYAGYGDYPDTDRAISLSAPSTSWDESTITWTNQPLSSGAVAQTSINSGAPFGYVDIDITDQVWSWLGAGIDYNRGLMISGPEDAGSDWAYRVFAARESQYPPQLVLTLN